MDTKLIESLADAISALPTEDYALLQQTLTQKLIKKTPGVAGGHACIRNTHIAVWTLISLLQQGSTESTVLSNFPVLTHFDLSLAQAYYQINTAEIDSLIANHHQTNNGNTQQVLKTDPFSLNNFAFVGMWKDRPELEDSTAWVRQLREQQWRG
ncbi:hypothetical protein Lepto7375DRAFT_0526 [Leptolyngbya sp. PCC 7375]|nr:hypothetical protein Lepto7375DRAFT_0526 [Leptolyngbya sp. PCC 7375]